LEDGALRRYRGLLGCGLSIVVGLIVALGVLDLFGVLPPRPVTPPAALLGTWVDNFGGQSTLYTFRADGTFLIEGPDNLNPSIPIHTYRWLSDGHLELDGSALEGGLYGDSLDLFQNSSSVYRFTRLGAATPTAVAPGTVMVTETTDPALMPTGLPMPMPTALSR